MDERRLLREDMLYGFWATNFVLGGLLRPSVKGRTEVRICRRPAAAAGVE